MDIIHNSFLDVIKANISKFENFDEYKSERFFSEVITNTIPQITEEILKTLRRTAPSMLKDKRKDHSDFTKRNFRRWRKGFDLFEMFLTILLEAGSDLNDEYLETAEKEKNYVFIALDMLHARGCQIGEEILILLKNGFADGAHARWRTLHEMAVISLFIYDNGKEVAERYLNHQVVESYKEMLLYQKYCDRLDYEPMTESEVQQLETDYKLLLKKYGKNYKNQYGWAVNVLNIENPTFSNIESSVKIDHMRPYYKMASHNVHANPKGIFFKLGLSESYDNILLAGPSNAGLTDPAHCTAITLCQISSPFLNTYTNLDRIVTMDILNILSEEIGDAFLEVQLSMEK